MNNDFVAARYRVLYGDVDAMGVVYYGNYFRLFERGRGEFIRERGMPYNEIEARGVMLPVTEAHSRYLGSARYDDLLLIHTWISEMRRASILFEYEIFRDETMDEKLVTGWTKHACLSTDRKIIGWPDWLKELLK